jgi:malonyl-CoA decarboxylase
MSDWRQSAFLVDLLQSIADRSRRLLGRDAASANGAAEAADITERLMSSQGEASGVALATRLLDIWPAMDAGARLDWFTLLAADYGPEPQRLHDAVNAWVSDRNTDTESRLHAAAEPRRQELFRRINLAPGGTAALVAIRAELLAAIEERPELASVDRDLVHLFASWFNRGFLFLRPVNWSSPADTLEKIIRYEAVHEIDGWDDLRRRLAPPDRRCFAFFHPQMPDDPLIFVEVALTRGMPDAIAPLLSDARKPLDPADADTAVFYSISNTQAGLKGITFGSFLIKQVVEELARDVPGLHNFATLSPMPGFATWWAARTAASEGPDEWAELQEQLAAIHDWNEIDPAFRSAIEPGLLGAAATYLLSADGAKGRPIDPVARFHLGNGASLDRINAFADLSPSGLRQSWGVMVNYRYDLASIERNHEAYAANGTVACSASVRRLAGARNGPTRRRARRDANGGA